MSVQLGMRAAALRAALERFSGSVATVTATDRAVRISVPYSLTWTLEQFGRVLHVVQDAPDWGGSSHPEPVMWAQYDPRDEAWQ
jgi:hypothetical protein